jgi:hypothetical protein
LRVRGFQPDLGILVGQIEHTTGDRELGVPDAAVVHHDRLADHSGAEGVDVPRDSVASIGNGQVRQRSRPRGSGCSVRLREFGDSGLGATHFDSLRSIR